MIPREIDREQIQAGVLGIFRGYAETTETVALDTDITALLRDPLDRIEFAARIEEEFGISEIPYKDLVFLAEYKGIGTIPLDIPETNLSLNPQATPRNTAVYVEQARAIQSHI